MTHFYHIFETASHSHFNKDTTRELKILAQKSAGINDSSFSIQIAQTIEQFEWLDSQLFRTQLEMANLVNYLHSVIMTIPGIEVPMAEWYLGKSTISTAFLQPVSHLHLRGWIRWFISQATFMFSAMPS